LLFDLGCPGFILDVIFEDLPILCIDFKADFDLLFCQVDIRFQAQTL